MDLYCKSCDLVKTHTNFTVDKHRSTGYNYYCKRCNRDGVLQRTYGITVAEYERLEFQQEGMCRICDAVCPQGFLAVDHDHVTGKVRGLLCRLCNLAIGNLRDNPALCFAAMKYLEHHQEMET